MYSRTARGFYRLFGWGPEFLIQKHPGELATKVGYFGVKSTKVHRVQMGTKPAKVGHLQSLGVSTLLKSTSVLRNEDLPPPGVRSVGGPKLLKWGLSGRGSNLLKSDRPLTYYPRVPKHHKQPRRRGEKPGSGTGSGATYCFTEGL